MSIDEALDALACPRCGAPLHRVVRDSAQAPAVRCEKCSAEYPIRDGVLDFLSPLDNKTIP